MGVTPSTNWNAGDLMVQAAPWRSGSVLFTSTSQLTGDIDTTFTFNHKGYGRTVVGLMSLDKTVLYAGVDLLPKESGFDKEPPSNIGQYASNPHPGADIPSGVGRTVAPVMPFRNSTSLIGLADVDGDGKADLVLQYDWYSIRRWQARMSNGSSFGYTGDWTTTNTPNMTVVGLADVNGDGKADLVLKNQSERIGNNGWYSLDLGELQKPGTRIDLEFDSIDGERKKYALTSSGMESTKRVAWIHVNRPGLVSVTAAVSGGQPTLHRVGFTELVSKSREISFAKAELTVFLLCEAAPVGVWILLVCLLRWLAYRALQKLPLPVRRHAGREIEVFLAVAKWAGVGCYGIWTFKDILTGVGIVLVR